MGFLNSLFDKIYVINLECRPDRLQEFTAMAKKNDFEFERFNAFDWKNIPGDQEKKRAQDGCRLSHHAVIISAKTQGLKNVLIFEDDAFMRPYWRAMLGDALKDVPPDWEMFYLGYREVDHLIRVNPNLVRINQGWTTHAYAVNASAFDKAAQVAKTFEYALDVAYADNVHKDGKCYGCSPGIAGQMNGISDIEDKNVNYSSLLS